MFKLFTIILFVSPVAYGQTGWIQAAQRAGFTLSIATSAPPENRDIASVPGIQNITPQGRRCVHMVKMDNGKYYRKNYWFNITIGQKSSLSQGYEYANGEMSSGEQTNGWHEVCNSTYNKWLTGTKQQPTLLENCRVDGPYFPRKLDTRTPICDIPKILGADVVSTVQNWPGDVIHPVDKGQMLFNTRLTIAGYKFGNVGCTPNSSGGQYQIGLEIFDGKISKGPPVFKNVVSGGPDVLLPFDLGKDETFVIRGLGNGSLGCAWFFQNTQVKGGGANLRIADNITACGLEVPSPEDIQKISKVSCF